MESVIAFLNWALEDCTMLIVWSAVFLFALVIAVKCQKRSCYLFAIGCVPMMIYFLWAWSGYWSTHEVATAFNRTAQLTSIAIWAMAIRRNRYEHC